MLGQALSTAVLLLMMFFKGSTSLGYLDCYIACNILAVN